MLPQPIAPGRFEVRGGWGSVQPLHLAPGVVTVGELELIAHAEAGGLLVDTRPARWRRTATIAGSISIDRDEVADRLALLPRDRPSAFFCNGPQCGATPSAIRTLLDLGHPPEAILYYRGGYTTG